MITILPVHWQLTVLKVVGCVIVGGEWCDKTRIAVKRRGINSRAIQCSLAGHFQDLASGNFYELLQNFSTPGVRFGYIPVNNSETLLYRCVFITASQPYCYSAGNHICCVLTGSNSLYYIYNNVRAHIIKIFEIIKYLILKIINLKVKYFNNYIL